MMIAARNAFLMSGAKLPYDAEVEYVETATSGKINTGRVFQATGRIVFKVFWGAKAWGDMFSITGAQSEPCVTIEPNSATGNIFYFWGRSLRNSYNAHQMDSRLLDGWMYRGAARINGGDYNIRPASDLANNQPLVFGGSPGRIYHFALEGECDYIPVRVAGGGALYDTVSGQLVQSSIFSPGPDKA